MLKYKNGDGPQMKSAKNLRNKMEKKTRNKRTGRFHNTCPTFVSVTCTPAFESQRETILLDLAFARKTECKYFETSEGMRSFAKRFS